MEKKNYCITIGGPSGSGKDFVAAALMEVHGDLYIKPPKCTTREKRPDGEKDNFLSDEEFDIYEKKGEFLLEESTVYPKGSDRRYNYFKKDIDEGYANEANVICTSGSMAQPLLKSEYILERFKTISFFIDVPVEILKQRIISRGGIKEGSVELDQRLAMADKQREDAKKAGSIFVVNDGIRSKEEIVAEIHGTMYGISKKKTKGIGNC